MKTILITGANRGLGLEFVKQLSASGMRVFACCRSPENATELQALAKQFDTISIYQLDVTQQAQVDHLTKELVNQPIDWLINNAGISGQSGVTIGNIDRDNFLSVMDTNCLSVVKVSEAFLLQLSKSEDKLIIVVSSRMASITDNSRGKSYAYRSSKAALNCVMRSFAIDVEEQGIKVILLHPGWVKTNMGGEDALTDTVTSVKGMLQQIDKHKAHSHAEVLRRFDGSDPIPW